MKQSLSAVLGTIALVAGATCSAQSDYPARPVTVIVPWQAGGNIDLVARVTAQAMQKQSGRTFLVENAPGAGSMIGTQRVASAKPDGYTLLWGSSSAFVILPHLSSNVKYHPVNSFETIGGVGGAPYLLVMNVESAPKTLREFVAHVRANPGKLSYGTPGTGSSPHVANEAMLTAIGSKALNVPFKGSQDMISAVLRRDVDWIIDFANGTLPQVKAGKFRVIAVTSAKRVPELPDVPAIQEVPELAGFDVLSWLAMFAPKGMAADQVRTMNRIMTTALKDPEVATGFTNAGFAIDATSPEALSAYVKREYDKWGDVIRKNNIKVE